MSSEVLSEGKGVSEAEIRDTNNVFRNIESYIAGRMDLRYNTVRLVTEYRRRGSENYEIFADRERASLLIDMLESRPFKFSKSDYDLYIGSGRVAAYDPYEAYFEGLPLWDGEDRIKQITEYIQVEDTPQYNFAWQLKKWLVRVVKCALEPNYFNKQILVFVGGEQNKGKTTFCRWLCPPALQAYYSEETPGGKDESIQLASNFMILYDELTKLTKSNEGEIKAILSKTLIKYRPPYARTEQTFTRRCSFLGTCNLSEFLTDPTGNVRFLAWVVKSIDFGYESIDREQLYAQVYHLYKSKFSCDMTPQDLELQGEYNQRFMVQTTEQDMIQQYLRPAKDVEPYGTTVYLWSSGQILQFLTDNIGSLKLNAVQLGRSLKLLGYKQIMSKINNCPKHVYPVCINVDAYVSTVLKGFCRREKEE